MIPLAAVRAAALSAMPWDRLDELVRAELAAGRKVAEIADVFITMVDAVCYTPGLSEDGSDAFGDTIDALTGNCHSDYCHTDFPKNTPPAENGDTAPSSAGGPTRGPAATAPVPSPRS